MAISYLSPASYMSQLPAMDKGPLSGFLSGMRDELANQITQRGFADDDLQREVTQQKLDEARQLQPLNVGIKNSEAIKAAADDDYYKNGGYAAMRDSNNAAQRSANDLQVSSNDVKQQMVAAPLWEKMADELKQMGGKVDWTNPDHRQWWDTWRQRMSKFAPNMPAFPDTGDTMKVIQTGDQASQWIQRQNAGSDRLFQQKLELAKAGPTIQAEASKANNAATNQTNKEIQAGHDARYLLVQKSKEQMYKLAAQDKQLFSGAVDAINRSPNGVLDGDVSHNLAIAERWAQANAQDTLSKNTAYKLLEISTDPNDQAKAEDMLKTLTMNNLKTVKGYMEAQQKLAGGGSSAPAPTATAPKADDMATMVKSAFGSYEPDKYEYRINPQTGKPQRKLK